MRGGFWLDFFILIRENCFDFSFRLEPLFFGWVKRRREVKEVFLMAATKLYVGNLNYRTTEDKLRELFAQFGEVSSVNILQGRGFGFVEMTTPESAQQAKERLNGTDFDGRRIIVNEARPRSEHRGERTGRKKPFQRY